MDLYVDVGYEDRMLGRALPKSALLASWYVREGERLRPGDRVADLESSGERFTIRIRFACVVDGLVANVGERLDLGTVLLRVGAERENVPSGYHYAISEDLLPGDHAA